jgi:hypothetical protein
VKQRPLTVPITVSEQITRPTTIQSPCLVVAAWGGLLVFIGAGAFALGMAIQNEAIAHYPVPQVRESPIYYCATGEEMPLYEPCKERKDQRDI